LDRRLLTQPAKADAISQHHGVSAYLKKRHGLSRDTLAK